MINADIRQSNSVFVQGKVTKYRFDPTANYNRWAIHEIADDLGCTSESYGKGQQRYTIVSYK